MPTKKKIFTFTVLGLLAMGLGYWYGMPKGKKEPEFLKKGLVAYYPFNWNAKDESGNGNDGEVKGVVLAEDRDGKAGRAYNFDSGHIHVNNHPSLQMSDQLTISAWIKNPRGSQPIILGKWYQDKKTWSYVLGSASKVGFRLHDGKRNFVELTGWSIKNKDRWNHLVATYDGQHANVYINGKMEAQIESANEKIHVNDNPVTIGTDGYEEDQFKGSIDDIRIYNRALSEAEVKELYEFEKPKTQQASTTTWTSDPSDPQNVIVEKEIRRQLQKPEGILTKEDLEKVKRMNLISKQLTEVKGLEKLTQLKDLVLYHNQLTDVKGLENLTQLTHLWLFYNQLTDVKGLENLTQLTLLNLRYNKLTEVKGLEKLNHLTYLDLENNPDLTKAQIAELQKALPKCRILSNATK